MIEEEADSHGRVASKGAANAWTVSHLGEHGHKLRHLQLREVLAPPEVSLARLFVPPDRTG